MSPEALWTRPDGAGRWSWGRGTQLVGHLVATNHGGVTTTDGHPDAYDTINALMMANAGIDAWPAPAVTPAPRPPE